MDHVDPAVAVVLLEWHLHTPRAPPNTRNKRHTMMHVSRVYYFGLMYFFRPSSIFPLQKHSSLSSRYCILPALKVSPPSPASSDCYILVGDAV